MGQNLHVKALGMWSNATTDNHMNILLKIAYLGHHESHLPNPNMYVFWVVYKIESLWYGMDKYYIKLTCEVTFKHLGQICNTVYNIVGVTLL
jgi:hypothetical protein